MNTTISIITPTYNRAYTLTRCYESIKSQTYRKFEWVITDDGSTDNTRELVGNWIQDNDIKIKYIYQKNSGLGKALNTCIENAEMELCTKLDSDDYLNEDALEKIAILWEENKSDGFCGILARRYIAGSKELSGNKLNTKLKSATMDALYNKYGLAKETELYVSYATKIVQKYPYPIIQGEKRIPTSWLYSKLAIEGYEFLILDEAIYAWDKQKDGITSNMNQKNNMINNFTSCVIYYKQLTHPVFTIKTRLKSMAFYTYLLLNDKKGVINIFKSTEYRVLFLSSLPLLLYLYNKFGLLKLSAE